MTQAPARAQGVALSVLVVLAVVAVSPSVRADPDPWVSRDKALHFDATAGIAAFTYGASAAWLVDARWKALALGGGVALAAGAGKELVDAAGWFGGDPSWKDLAWDFFGAVAGLALAWSVDLLVGGVTAQRPALSPAPGAGAGPTGMTRMARVAPLVPLAHVLPTPGGALVVIRF